MITKSICPECRQGSYIPIAPSAGGATGRVLKLELRSEHQQDVERFNKIFPRDTAFTLKVERSMDPVTRAEIVTITPQFDAPPAREITARPAPKIPQDLNELREVAVRSGIIDAEKMTEEQIHQAIAKRTENIGKGARGRAQLNGLEPAGVGSPK